MVLISLLLLLIGCDSNNGNELDYSSTDLWFDLPSVNEYDVDVFYVLPTCVWDWSDSNDSNGVICHYADVYNDEQRAAMIPSYELARDIFAEGSCNFYAPYYRQITLESWMEGDSLVDARFPNAMADINSAWNYYLENINNNRPFILAGYSQGGKGVVELMKGLTDEQSERMVAAYVVGYRVTESELNSYTTIVGAKNSVDTGVTVCYSSVESPECMAAVISPSALCINPINWCVDETPAQLNDTTTVTVDTINKVLLVEGLDSEEYYLPILGNLFVKGNYHLQELTFYQDYLNENVKVRIDSYLQ